MGAQYCTNIQAARAIAAIGVVVLLTGPQLDATACRPRGETIPGSAAALNMGVDVFFVVSGFVMLQVAWNSFGDRAAVRPFLQRRAIRLVPLYWLCTTLTLAVTVLRPDLVDQSDPSPGYVLASYLFVPWPDLHGELFPILVPGWTLAYEAFFYAVLSAVLVLRRRAALLVGTAGLVGLVLGAHLPGAPSWLHDGWGNPLVLEFVAGAGLCCLHRSGVRFSRRQAMLVGCLGIGLVVLASVIGSGAQTRFAVLGIPAAVLVAAAVLGPQMSGRGIGRPLLAVGDASYAVYLTHTVTLKAVALGLAVVEVPRPLGILVAVAACVAVGMLVDRFVDRPLGRALRRRFMAGSRRRSVSGDGLPAG